MADNPNPQFGWPHVAALALFLAAVVIICALVT